MAKKGKGKPDTAVTTQNAYNKSVAAQGDNGPRLEIWSIDRIKPYENNPRTLPEKAVAKVAGSLKQFGFQKPIVVDEHGIIIAGHVVYKAAQEAGITRVPVFISSLDEAKARAYRLADNRTAQETDWLDELLRDELTALDELGFDLDSLGFDDKELRNLMADEADLERAEETPEPPVNPVTVLGDVWVLGNHRIICGSSTEADVVAKLLGPVKPHLMVTDPPYGVNYDPKWRNVVKRADGSRVGAKATGVVENDDKADWTEAWVLFPGDVAYVWHGGLHSHTVADSLSRADFQLRAQIIWRKGQLVIGRGDYHCQHEPCWYPVKKGRTGHYDGGRKQPTVWDIDAKSGFAQVKDGADAHHGFHSTQKLIECMKRPIENNSSVGQAVYEPFSGSGTTIMAAELTGRHCYAIELNPAYVDVAVKRWQDYTGQKATHAETGQTFDEVCSARYETGERLKDAADSYEVGIAALRAKLIEGTDGEGKKKAGAKAAPAA